VRVPKGRPPTGDPPFTWEESATDALKLKRVHINRDWSIEKIAYVLEGYNGWGYRLYHPEVKSPYLWSFSNHYTRGKYVRDGSWSPTAVSKQVGAMVLLNRMVARGLIEISFEPLEEAARRTIGDYGSGPFQGSPFPEDEAAYPEVGRERRPALQPATGAAILELARQHIGEQYVWGASAPFENPRYRGPWDCAEFASWVLYQVSGIVYGCIDNDAAIEKLEPWGNSWYRDALRRGRLIPIQDAKRIAGAFYVRRKKGDVPAHVAISDGKGRTVEAMDTAHGVTTGRVERRGFNAAVLIPSVSYS
jgi:hypothetical protein